MYNPKRLLGILNEIMFFLKYVHFCFNYGEQMHRYLLVPMIVTLS